MSYRDVLGVVIPFFFIWNPMPVVTTRSLREIVSALQLEIFVWTYIGFDRGCSLSRRGFVGGVLRIGLVTIGDRLF